MAQTNTAKLRASNKQAGRKIGGSVAIFLFLALLGLFMALPIYLTVVMSVKPAMISVFFVLYNMAKSPIIDVQR